MNTAPRRFAATTLALAAVGVSGAAASGVWPSGQPFVLMAILWLLLLGWGFRALLGRHLRFNDRLAYAEAQVGIERHARALAERALADTHTNLCRLIHQQEQVRETERKRIARDIHDDLGQHLLAMKMELSLLQVGSAGADTPIQRKVGMLLQNLDLSIASLRTIINDLRPPALERGLQNAMEHQLAEFSRLNGIRHELAAAPEVFDGNQDRAVDAMLFRILQESLANVARHAQATEVKVALERSGDLLTLKVRDNGIGMAAGQDTRGCGLVGIADRVAAAGGSFAIDSEPGNGTMLSLSIPLQRPLSSH
jgi:signal transduction histidine kinase